MSAVTVKPKFDPDWLATALAALEFHGCCVIEGILDDAMLPRLRSAMYLCRERVMSEIGAERLAASGEIGVLRLMMKFDPIFYDLLELPELLAIVDATVSPTSILHLQNGLVLPSFPAGKHPRVFQNSYHRDFPRHVGQYVASINALFAIDHFSRDNGATYVILGSHHRDAAPPPSSVEAMGIPMECEAGAIVVFDSTLWHAAGTNVSGHDRLAINHQFTRSWIKQQIDYVRAIGEPTVTARPPRTQQLLGYYTRVVTSLDEYYRPEAERLYRKGQG